MCLGIRFSNGLRFSHRSSSPFPHWGSTCCPPGSDGPLVSLHLSCPCDSHITDGVSHSSYISLWNSSAWGEINWLQMSPTPLNVTPKRRGPSHLLSQPIAICCFILFSHYFSVWIKEEFNISSCCVDFLWIILLQVFTVFYP